ncbi:hypothetical protein [Spirosoma spitsbergense]|uniref:hypothetical protein n=1 Tax=Spirosoma spitsbergense TaxID=431554 RepID=UPI0003798719|nr:hypothetical protein [Spirosoma spitsbergense]
MALPDKPADLFGPKNNLPTAPESRSLLNLGYSITWEPLHDDATPPEIVAQLAHLYEASRFNPNRALAERLRQLVRQYPDVPALKNYLMTTYVQTGQQSRANEVLEQTIAQHPRYLLGLVNKANQLLTKDDTGGVEKLFGGPPTDIAWFYPERSEFHASEVAHFTFMSFNYYLAKDDPDAALMRLRLMRDLSYHTKDQLRSMKDRLDMTRMRYNMARMQEGYEKAITVDGYFRATDQQTTEPPVFEHPEMQWLYEYGLMETAKPLPADKRDALLALPRPSLTRDLSKALLDIVYRYEFFGEQDWDEEHHNFASHALLLATELRADECLDAVLETLRQDDEFREFWWGDYLNEFYEPYFRQLLPGHADVLKAFMCEPDVNTSSKEIITGAYSQEALANPTLKPAAQTWYTDILTYLLDHSDNEHLLDTDLIAWMIGDIVDLQLTDLLPLIRRAYEHNLVTESIQGDLASVEKEIVQRRYPTNQMDLRPLAEQYEYLQNPTAYRNAHLNPEREKFQEEYMSELEAQEDEWAFLYEDEEDDEDELPNGAVFPSQQRKYLSSPAQPIIKAPAPGRNDKVSVRYTDGTVVRDVKYKKVEADVDAGKCELL